MKKRIIVALILVAMLFSLAACAKKTTICITFADIDGFEIIQAPSGMVSLSSDENTIYLTVKNDGQYPITIKADDGNEYTIAIAYEKGTANVDAGDLSVIAGLK